MSPKSEKQEEFLKSALTPPDRGLIPVGPGVFVSKLSVDEIVEKLRREGKLQPRVELSEG